MVSDPNVDEVHREGESNFVRVLPLGTGYRVESCSSDTGCILPTQALQYLEGRRVSTPQIQ